MKWERQDGIRGGRSGEEGEGELQRMGYVEGKEVNREHLKRDEKGG